MNKMSPEEIDKHVQALIEGKTKAVGLEATVVKKLMDQGEVGAKLQKRVSALKKELAATEAQLQANAGECTAYVNLLVEAENSRREDAVKAPTPPAMALIRDALAPAPGPEPLPAQEATPV